MILSERSGNFFGLCSSFSLLRRLFGSDARISPCFVSSFCAIRKQPAQASGGDVERPLTELGRRDASRIGNYLRDEKFFPDLALTSTARRARETLELALDELAREIAVAKKKKLYLAEPRALFAVVKATPADVHTLLIVGHNPGLAAFASDLAGAGDAQRLAAMGTSFPTTALAVVSFDLATWTDVEFKSGTLERFVTPASLGGEEDE